MAPRMKVFCWSDGLHAYTVATTSRARALAAWGFKRDLFREGLAKEIGAGPDYARALEAPGETVQRELGGTAAAVRRPERPKRDIAGERRRREAGRRVAALEAQIAALDADAEAAAAALARERKALEARGEAERADFERRRSGLRVRLEAARERAR